MKVFNVIFGVCLGVLALRGAVAVDGEGTARGAMRRDAQNVSATPAMASNSRTSGQTQSRVATSRLNARDRGATKTVRDTAKSVVSRATTRGTTPISSGTPQSGVAERTTTATRTSTPVTKTRTAARTPARRTSTPSTRGALTSAGARSARSAVRATTAASGVRRADYQKCREIYYECMDEFCANKDANLRRCACSARATEFDDVKRQMSRVEDKMLDFNQRLLMVNMDAADVNAINTATAGEDAFYAAQDKTKSKQALDEIAKKLNATFGDDNGSGGTSLAPIALSLNADSAFDNIDSLLGAQTTTKTGVALYNAALPVCREMAMEVCTNEEFSLATSGYQMQIEQDCNTVSKAYQSKVDQARAKVFESNALLDISRLDTYQTRNSDDILTCKRKMLDLLTDGTVCGTNMEKCLDMTGRYIDPTTGQAFLTSNLADLATLVTRPQTGQTWVSANRTSAFLTYLNGKKSFLESATKNCQDIADNVWDIFIEDALAQIKLAQTSKLEEIRQACTTLTTECLNNASDSLTEFDSRAISIFGITATKTALSMCSDVQTACTALMDADGDTSWSSGVADVNTIKTYDSIISSCTQVGRNCIIQACRSLTGNFGLCEDIDFAANRHSILERSACWSEVMNCVASAGDDSIMSAMNLLGKTAANQYSFYSDMYESSNQTPIDDLCTSACDGGDNTACAKCRITERIWGNCEYNPSFTDADDANRIKTPTVSTLLSWFAKNTNTDNNKRSCVKTRCTDGQQYMSANGIICLNDTTDVTDDKRYCPTYEGANMPQTMTINGTTNCCFNNDRPERYMNGACCTTGNVQNITDDRQMCMPTGESNKKVLLENTSDARLLVCVGANNLTGAGATNGDFPGGDTVRCNGTFIFVPSDNHQYTEPTRSGSAGQGIEYTPKLYYYTGKHSNDYRHEAPGTSGFLEYE